jgi:protein SCO1/2
MNEKQGKRPKIEMRTEPFFCSGVTLTLIALALLFPSCDNSSGLEEPISNTQEERKLPFHGEYDILLNRDASGNLLPDTAYYAIPKFSFTNQNNQETSWKQFENYITIADFFFTECPTICPVMSSQLARIQDKIKADGLQEQVRILSFSVKPQHDTPEVLKAYGEKIGADFNIWNFVTGKPADIYEIAEDGFLLTAFPSDSAAGGIFHTDKVTLLDREMRIRGYYDGTSTKVMDTLYEDLKILLKEK